MPNEKKNAVNLIVFARLQTLLLKLAKPPYFLRLTTFTASTLLALVGCGGGSSGNNNSNNYNTTSGDSPYVIFSEIQSAPDVERSFVYDLKETSFSETDGRVAFSLRYSVGSEDGSENTNHYGVWVNHGAETDPAITSQSVVLTDRGNVVLASVHRLEFHRDDSLGIYASTGLEGENGLIDAYFLVSDNETQEVAYKGMKLPAFNSSQSKTIRAIEDVNSVNNKSVLEIRTADFDYGIWLFDEDQIVPIAMSSDGSNTGRDSFPLTEDSCSLQYAEASRVDVQDYPESRVGVSDIGDIFFLATLTGPQCINPRQSIVKYSNGSYSPLVSTDESLSQTEATFSSLRIVNVTNEGRVHFEAFINDSTNQNSNELYSYWTVSPEGEVNLIAVEGETFSATDSIETIAGVIKEQLKLIPEIGPLESNISNRYALHSKGSTHSHIVHGIAHDGQPHSDLFAINQAALTQAFSTFDLISYENASLEDSANWSIDSLDIDDQGNILAVSKHLLPQADDPEASSYRIWQYKQQGAITAPVLDSGDRVSIDGSPHQIVADQAFELLGVHENTAFVVVNTRFVDTTTTSIRNPAIVAIKLD